MTDDPQHETSSAAATATLGGGCFWCLEAVFQQLEGVIGVRSGYSGGHVEAPSYEQVCRAGTGHAEVVQVTYDPQILDYRALLEVFFAIHDPTTKDRQGHDVGPQYRSVIFAHDAHQAATARQVMAALADERIYDDPIVTELADFERFWPAEDYHDDYYRRNPGQPYCQMVVGPKVAKFRARFAHRLRADGA